MKKRSRKKYKKITDKDFQKFRVMYPCKDILEVRNWLKQNMQPLEYIQGRLLKLDFLYTVKKMKFTKA